MGSRSLRGKGHGIINKTGCVFGVASLIIFIFVRLFSENPYEMLHMLDVSDIIPPLWLLNLLTFLWEFLIGYAAGLVTATISYGGSDIKSEISAYRGGLFFLVSFFLSQIWHSVFFQGRHLLLALVIILATIISSIICAYFWYSTKKSSSLVIASYGLWLFYLFILNLSIILHI